MNACPCDLCKKELEWSLEYGTCYRCVHGLPCQIAVEDGQPCNTVLDVLAGIEA
jgi:hypothetical protein